MSNLEFYNDPKNGIINEKCFWAMGDEQDIREHEKPLKHSLIVKNPYGEIFNYEISEKQAKYIEDYFGNFQFKSELKIIFESNLL